MNSTVRRSARVTTFLHLFGIVLLGALLIPAQLYAAAAGSVRGVVHDPQDQPVAGANVKIKAAASEWVQMTHTDTHGEFFFPTVAIGDRRGSFAYQDAKEGARIPAVGSSAFSVQ